MNQISGISEMAPLPLFRAFFVLDSVKLFQEEMRELEHVVVRECKTFEIIDSLVERG